MPEAQNQSRHGGHQTHRSSAEQDSQPSLLDFKKCSAACSTRSLRLVCTVRLLPGSFALMKAFAKNAVHNIGNMCHSQGPNSGGACRLREREETQLLRYDQALKLKLLSRTRCLLTLHCSMFHTIILQMCIPGKNPGTTAVLEPG